jgi:peptidyl-prolyl cis-trans isomerase SurA
VKTLNLLPLALVLLLTLLPQADTQARVVELNSIVAVVDDSVITRLELDERIVTIQRQLRERNTAAPAANLLERQVLERLIVERVQLDLAKRINLRVDDETLDRVLANIAADSRLSLAQFRQVLEQDGVRYQRFREQIRHELVIARLRQSQVENRITITPQEVEEFLATSQSDLDQNIEYRVQHLLIAVPEAANPSVVTAAQQRIDELRQRLLAGEEFSRLAVAHSDGQQALEGGELGWRKAAQLPTLFSDEVRKLEVGGVSPILRSASGFHLLRLAERRGQQQHIVRQVNARHILIKTSSIVSDFDARERLSRLRDRIINGELFADLATAHSEDSGSARQGGELGWFDPASFVATFRQTLLDLPLNTISQPFRSEFGWHIAEVLGWRDHDNTRQVLENQALNLLRERRIEEETESWLRQLRDEAWVEIRLGE